jgi:hypothetical protein
MKKNKIYQTQNLNNYNTSRKEDLYIQPRNTSHCKKSAVKMGKILNNKLPVGMMRT